MSRRRSKVVSRCFGIVLGKTPGTILFMLPQAEAVPCTHSWEPTIAVLLPLSLRTSARTGVAIRFPFCRGTFFPRRKKVPKERRQNQGFGILSAAEVLIVSVPSCPANRSVQNSCRAFVSPLRLPPRRTLCLCWLSKRGHILHLPRVAMWASPPTKCAEQAHAKRRWILRQDKAQRRMRTRWFLQNLMDATAA